MMTLVRLLSWVVLVAWSNAIVGAVVADVMRVASGNRFGHRALAVFGRAHQELWLFVPVGWAFEVAHDASRPHAWLLLLLDMGQAVMWWNARNFPDDENRWKRRGRRAASAVKRAGARLVVVPAGATS